MALEGRGDLEVQQSQKRLNIGCQPQPGRDRLAGNEEPGRIQAAEQGAHADPACVRVTGPVIGPIAFAKCARHTRLKALGMRCCGYEQARRQAH